MKLGHFILNEEGVIVETDLMTWAHWFETSQDRFIKQEDVMDCWVSTVFLGLDYNFEEGPPLLFETMVFRPKRVGPPCDREWCSKPDKNHSHPGEEVWSGRTYTRELALEMHAEAVKWVKEGGN